MAKVVSFVICDSIQNMPSPQNELVPTLVAPQIALRPQFIPSNFSFAMAVGISDIDLQAENQMRFVILDPGGVNIHDTGDSVLPKIEDHDVLPREYQGFMVNMDIRNLTIPREGEYRFMFYMNGDCIGEYSVPIFKRAT